MTAGCPVRMGEKHLCFVIGPRLLGSVMCPRYRLTIHKKHRFLRMRTGHPAVKPSAHTTEAGKTACRWIEEQVRSRCRAERPGLVF
ncbi:unnamed protein product [Staurois parvus]|uniref:Uncharacterized protein n=1 Tax=Staurois parvus TaxID=386267 RepID=A0ABN9AYT2_9NEOB|nr:unnamed protein product [Staurois parvus]